MRQPSGARAVLGIDAAWTLSQPSGVALVCQDGEWSWRLCAVAPSYPAYGFLSHPDGDGARPASFAPDAAQLLATTRRLCGQVPTLIAIDMPLSRTPITARRTSDDAVSRAYGARHCSTHTPSALRPGPISDRLTEAFAAEGYGLATSPPEGLALIEVYPHPALVELARETRRLPYKAGKVRAYWPELTPVERRGRLIAGWARIVAMLDEQIAGVSEMLALPTADAGGRALKGFEDMLDAVVCAWVGVCVLEGRALPYGDETSAIWIPTEGLKPVSARWNSTKKPGSPLWLLRASASQSRG